MSNGTPGPNGVTKMNIRKTNPTLYRLSMLLATCAFALAVNFWKYTPAFSPFGIPKWVPGIVFAALGGWLLVSLHVWRDLRPVRLGQAAALFTAIFWGSANTQQTQTFGGPASWQLPIMFAFYVGVAVVALLDAPINPLTEQK